VWYDKKGQDENYDTVALGETFFDDDGTVTVFVDYELQVKDAVEIFAHELAHVAAGEKAGHGEEWEKAFDAIFTEYNRIGEELFEKHDTIEVMDGRKAEIEVMREPPKEE